MNSANDKYGSSLDRPPAPGKPVDPATRLSELLAQSLEELTRPFDPPHGSPHPARAATPAVSAEPPPIPPHLAAAHAEARAEPLPEPTPEETRIDADKALAELEAELFAAAKQVDSEPSVKAPEPPPLPPEVLLAEEGPRDLDQPLAEQPSEPSAAPESTGEAEREIPLLLREEDLAGKPEAAADAVPLAPAEPTPDADAEKLIARVRRLMLVSMLITVIAVGSVFTFVGYRMMTGAGETAKTADKLPPASAIPNDITLSLPRGAKLIQSSVANDQLVMTLEIDGKIEVRTFDVKTLQPVGRLSFTAIP